MANTGIKFYLFLEVLWAAFWFGSAIAILVSLDSAVGSKNIQSILVAPLHLLVLGAVLYARTADAHHVAAVIGFIFAMFVDVILVLDNALHVSKSAAAKWAFGLNMAVASFGLFISIYAFGWYVWKLSAETRAKKSSRL